MNKRNESFDFHFPQIDSTGDNPIYWRMTGGANGRDFDVSPVPTANVEINIGHGYFYSVAFTVDGDSNWLTINQPELVEEGVAYRLFRHYGELQKAGDALANYNALLHGLGADSPVEGLIQIEKKQERGGRKLRFKTIDDIPSTAAVRIKYRGY